jgi:glycosyltransferase involved in cell wall biosynthesis
VSKTDADEMRRLFGVTRVTEIPTGVNIEYFQPLVEGPSGVGADLVFVGSMDWLPNVDGVLYFAREVLPLIRRKRPDCSVAIVGRTPPPKINELAAQDKYIQVTGTVPDIRPYLWGSAVSIVPLRIGGGTRLKIYEAMAAKIPVVSTTVGAEGLTVNPPDDIRIGDTPEEFAAQCLELLADAEARRRVATAAWEMVNANFSWDHVSRCFERVMEKFVG